MNTERENLNLTEYITIWKLGSALYEEESVCGLYGYVSGICLSHNIPSAVLSSSPMF